MGDNMDEPGARDGSKLKRALDLIKQRRLDTLKRCADCGRELGDDYKVVIISGEEKRYCEYCFITMMSKLGDSKIG